MNRNHQRHAHRLTATLCSMALWANRSATLARCLVVGGALMASQVSAHAAESDALASLLGQSHQALVQGDFAQAQAALSRAATLDAGNVNVRFQQALVLDAAGRHADARALYDGLTGAAVQVPSAVNLVALGRYYDASQIFARVEAGNNAYETGYAKLWMLWIAAQPKGQETPADVARRLESLAASIRVDIPYQQALVRLYRDKGSVDDVFAAINAMPEANDLQRRDARTEAALFAGAYLQHARADIAAAHALYAHGYTQASLASLERPLLGHITQALVASHRR